MAACANKRMRTIVAHPQVEFLTCRVIPPAFGNAKVVVQFVFHGPEDGFAFAPSFVAATPRVKGQQTDPPKTPLTAKGYRVLTAGHLLGIDFNRISPFIMEMATPDQALEIKEALQEVFKIGQKLRWVDYCGTANAAGLLQTLLTDPEFVQALRPQPDLVQALEQEAAQTPEAGTGRDLRVQWRRQTLFVRIQCALRDAVSNSADRVVQEQAKIALRHLWRAWARFRRGLYPEIAAVQRALAVCWNELEALDWGTPNWGRIYHHLTHRHPDAYPKWKPEVLAQKLRDRVARLQKEPTLLHQRKAHLKTQLDLEVSLAGARILIQQGADAVATEDLTLTTRDKPKVLAKYITDMPKQQEIVERMALWTGYYHTAVRWLKDPTAPQFEVNPSFVDPRGTSKTHANCGGAVRAVRGQSDIQICVKCGVAVPRHGNSAQLIAQRGIQKRQEEIGQV